ncbi:fructosamine kinase family protein [Aquiflexum gelatinilyticum]|uniref:Fructosamine kinase family protein n=1 Tax=Aquiflexum gelatinilyticum TaxID=2961943 RepID=A0A9X2P280_9BACT|nr:fructosamine kinase family protein [Aquiflexum gelatinilyticum]MCR9014469.1 fructosamine kinase family protein [Aquiflexum gelatinilyticum]
MFEHNAIFERILFLSFGPTIRLKQARLIAAGNVNQGVFLETSEGSFFLKTNFEEDNDIFEKEADGLNEMRANSPLKIPKVYQFGKEGDYRFILMEWIQTDKPNPVYWQELGMGLAQMHMTTQQDFGYKTPNYIASIPQKNTVIHAWSEFFIQNRLEPLIGRAYYENLIDLDFFKKFQQIYPVLEDFFPKEKPALLHGDLWSGNIMRGKNGMPVLIDPAVYYGHREMDLAFSRLFGGFEAPFYESYETVFPLEPGFEDRIPVYNLYPLLVHLLLFGKSYLPGIEKTVNRLLG